MAKFTSKMPGQLEFESGAVALGAGTVVVTDLIVDDVSYVGVNLVVATAALTALDIFAQFSRDGAWHDISPADWTAPDGVFVTYASGNLDAAGVGNHAFTINVLPLYALRIRGTSAGAAVVTASGTGKR